MEVRESKRLLGQTIERLSERSELNLDSDSRYKKIEKEEKKRRKEVKKAKSVIAYNECGKAKSVIAYNECGYDLSEDKENLAQTDSQGNEEVTNGEAKKNTTRGIPSLYQCAEALKSKVHLVRIENNLYYYNGICYDIVNEMNIVKIYREKVDRKLNNEKSMNTILQLNKFLQTDSEIPDKSKSHLGRIAVFKNGIYDVEREKLLPHSPEVLSFSYVNANYVEGGTCDRFDEFLKTVTGGNKVLMKRMWMFLGYLLMQTIEAKVFFIMGEKPDSGKSLLGHFLETLFPHQYISNIALNDFNKEFSLAPLVGACLNISLDLPSTRLNLNAISRIKMLTGGDGININQKYVQEFRYKNRAKFVFASNFPITIADKDTAFWQRLIYLPFDYSIPKDEQDPLLLDQFEAEKNAIISKALHYAKKLIDANFVFPTTDTIEQKICVWKGENIQTIENFLKDVCQCDEVYKGELVDDLYSAYINYCEERYVQTESRIIFKRFLEEEVGLNHYKMRKCKKSNPQSAFRGIKLMKGE